MAELVPYPFDRLVRRMFRELDERQAIFDLPARKFVLGDPAHDVSVSFHGAVAATPFGPAAGPHTQLAQNIVLAWLAGSRIIELKTVQVIDDLKIARPCIDVRNVGFNVEWSQELRVEQSIEEYVKASMLVDLLVASGKLALAPGFERTVFDMSVGYDLAGIKSPKVRGFLDAMRDASAVVERLRAQIPEEYASLRGTAFRTRISNTLTLSTFHGCPPDEIERIGEHLLRDVGVDLVVKLNPTLLGPVEMDRLLHDKLGYTDLHVPAAAFEKDATWEQAVGITERLNTLAHSLGRSFGVKFSNTLIVPNTEAIFPASEGLRYLSGAPLHVLAMTLVERFRERFGSTIPVSFSAGIDKGNFAAAVGLGLVPVTACTDLLKQGGCGRAQAYFQALYAAMDAVGARSIDGLIVRDCEIDVADAIVPNTRAYVSSLADDPRYSKAKNSATPKKIGSKLALFDCVTCDLCVPVCPNNANFVLSLPKGEIPIVKVVRVGGTWVSRQEGALAMTQRHQIGNFADFCNDCGNCDVFCPEDGGPYILKPRFFGSREEWDRYPDRDGFFLARDEVLGRVDGVAYGLAVAADRARFQGPGFDVRFVIGDEIATLDGDAVGEIDLTWYRLMDLLRGTLLAPSEISYVTGG